MENVRERIREIKSLLSKKVFGWSAVRGEIEEFILENYGEIAVDGEISVEETPIENSYDVSHNIYRLFDEKGCIFAIEVYETIDEDECEVMNVSIYKHYDFK